MLEIKKSLNFATRHEQIDDVTDINYRSDESSSSTNVLMAPNDLIISPPAHP